jgi:hypothetical protein
MSLSSRESKLAFLRETLAQLNSEFFLTLSQRRSITLNIQDLKESKGHFSHFDPEKEKEVFILIKDQLCSLSIKELLAFSLVMEDQAMAMAPGSYPTWSNFIHLTSHHNELYEMANPIMLKVARPEFFNRLRLSSEFSFLKDF